MVLISVNVPLYRVVVVSLLAITDRGIALARHSISRSVRNYIFEFFLKTIKNNYPYQYSVNPFQCWYVFISKHWTTLSFHDDKQQALNVVLHKPANSVHTGNVLQKQVHTYVHTCFPLSNTVTTSKDRQHSKVNRIVSADTAVNKHRLCLAPPHHYPTQSDDMPDFVARCDFYFFSRL